MASTIEAPRTLEERATLLSAPGGRELYQRQQRVRNGLLLRGRPTAQATMAQNQRGAE